MPDRGKTVRINRNREQETGVAMRVETERIKDRFNRNVFPLGYQVVPKGTRMG